MSNITFDSTSFSEQLGIYDFFNVLVSGFIFILGVSVINPGIKGSLWDNVTVFEGFLIVALTYISGLIMQELGSFADDKVFGFYRKATRSILKSGFNDDNKVAHNDIVKNPLLWKRYRELADTVVTDEIYDKFENSDVNGVIFSVCQYYVSVNGKDKKVEKMRALFSMSKTLMSCFATLAFLTLLELFFDIDMKIEIWNVIGLPERSCTNCIDKLLLALIFTVIAVIFYFRAKKIMRRFLLILFGTYDAIIRLEKNSESSSKASTQTGN